MKDTRDLMVKKIGQFQFTGAKMDRLEATEYTLVNIAVDLSGSVCEFKNDLEKMVVNIIKACEKSPRRENLLIRITEFSSRRSVAEVCGFELLQNLKALGKNLDFYPDGLTPLYDACYEGAAAIRNYGLELARNDYGVNAILFVITDGYENASQMDSREVKKEIEKTKNCEELESFLSILIGINADEYKDELKKVEKELSLDKFIDAGEASKKNLAQLADFVSQSISSQSLALGKGQANILTF